ncbi:CARDB domain-containing protein, partial [Acinetobacter calcoaceticus]|uniref:CARDB domain-containing protein n=1 Tax=Acinetobacter calcoaceticus TaxID=471 RepID=UPI0018DD44CE
TLTDPEVQISIADYNGHIVYSNSSNNINASLFTLNVGSYTVKVKTTSLAQQKYGFKLLNLAQVQQIESGQAVEGRLKPEGEMLSYQIDVDAGDRVFIDFDQLITQTYGYFNGVWKQNYLTSLVVIDPYGRKQIISRNDLNNLGSEFVASVTGKYTILFDELDRYDIELPFQMAVYVHAPSNPIVIDLNNNASKVDFSVQNLTVQSSDRETIKSGSQLEINWILANIGNNSSFGDFTDRVLIKNKTTGEIIAESLVPYSEQKDGSISSNQSITRTTKIKLPEGISGAGDFEVIVEADVYNQQNETVESRKNNQTSYVFKSELRAYPNLTIEHISLSPALNWQAGDSVTLNWEVKNSGQAPATGSWVEKIEIINLTTGTVVVSKDLLISNQTLEQGNSTQRQFNFIWPSDKYAVGQFAIKVKVDALNTISEFNQSGSLENDNEGMIEVVAGPDLVVKNIQLLQPQIQAGERVTVVWQDVNQGSVTTPTNFQDRIIIRARNTDGSIGKTILNFAVAFNGQDALPIKAGEVRNRSFSFTMPEGVAGAGQFVIEVVADSNITGQGIIYEVNVLNNAEINNSSTEAFISSPKMYADLAVSQIIVPETIGAGNLTQVQWTVTNRGDKAAEGQWVDRIILSRDSVIGNADDIILASYNRVKDLNVGESYQQKASITMPARLEGSYYIAVISDINQIVKEPDSRANNQAISAQFNVVRTYADLSPEIISSPTVLGKNESGRITWKVTNNGTLATDVNRWVDTVYISTKSSFDSSASVLGSVTHTGGLAVGSAYQAYLDFALNGNADQYYLYVKTDSYGAVYEPDHTGNNIVVSQPIALEAEKLPDIQVSDISVESQWRTGNQVQLTYTLTNSGTADFTGFVYDHVRLVNITNPSQTYILATPSFNRSIQKGESIKQQMTLNVPALSLGAWRLEVISDVNNYVRELDLVSHQGTQSIEIVSPDLVVGNVKTTGVLQGGQNIDISWTTYNQGTAKSAQFKDIVYLSLDDVVDYKDIKIGEVVHSEIESQQSISSILNYKIPESLSGRWRLLIVTDAENKNFEYDAEQNNQYQQSLEIAKAEYADLIVSNIKAPTQVIGDPASLSVEWTVSNIGTGTGLNTTWTDTVIYSTDDIIGNSDDIVLGKVVHDGALEKNNSYTSSIQYRFGPNFTRHGHVFVQTDSLKQVWENDLESNNTVEFDHLVDVMPKAYVDLQLTSLSIDNAENLMSGSSTTVRWAVSNNGIGITDKDLWLDRVWLSSQADGKGQSWDLGSVQHLGYLAASDSYEHSLTITLPDGLSGNYYLNVGTNIGSSVFEFIHNDNNQKTGLAVPIQLAEYPDLVVTNITLPDTATENSEVEFTWTVTNQGSKNANGSWTDSLRLISLDGSKPAISLGNYTYTQGLESGKSYSRTEKLRLPSRLEGAWRLEVITNADLGKNSAGQIYEYATARQNNSLVSDDILSINLNPKPDLRVTAIEAPDKVIAGGKASVKFTVSNMGPLVTNTQWSDSVYLSLDGTLSSDDILVGRYSSGAALAPTQSYTTITDEFTVPLRYRGDVYIIAVADSGNVLDEYPNENNNIRVEKLYIEPIPFADLVTSDVVAPDQATHGSKITVDYKVTNKGSAKTQGDQSNINSWVDSVWLTVDKRQPNPSKGDIKLGDIRHTGHLEVGEDYLGQITVTIPEGTYSGKYYISVWSDTYDAILEDTLATNINSDDPSQVNNNNFKARAIDILGFAPPDLSVIDIQAPREAIAAGSYQFSYTVQNLANEFDGSWTDEVWLADQADLAKATIKWKLGEFSQKRKLGYKETYTVEQMIPLLAPSVTGLQLVVQTNMTDLKDSNGKSKIEKNKLNNTLAVASLVTASASDLAVTQVVVDQQVFSGEAVNVAWTVENKGADVWVGTRSWTDYIVISAYPEYMPEYSKLIGSVQHSNAQGLKTGERYTATGQFKVPVGYDGQYYIFVLSDAKLDIDQPYFSPDALNGFDNDGVLKFYQGTVFEKNITQNNVSAASLNIVYREPDLVIKDIQISNPNPNAGDTVTVSWTVKNEGSRDTRVSSWFDGIYLSNDKTIDTSDYPVVDRGNDFEVSLKVKQTLIRNAEGKVDVLKIGESYTQTATFTIPSAIGGDFNIIVKADTNYVFGYSASSSIRKSLNTLNPLLQYDQGAVLEFKDEANNEKSIALTINYVSPPDLQVVDVTSPTSVISGQKVDITYKVKNLGGRTPSDQGAWTDLIYLSTDRVLDLSKDKLLGFVDHSGGLAANAEYSASIQAKIPTELNGTYYVFVVTDPAYYRGGATGKVLEFENDLNNTLTSEQPLLIIQPDPVDLQVTDVLLPNQVKTGEKVRIEYTVKNVADYQAHGQWSDAVYLSRNNSWDNQDILLGRFTHQGGLDAHQQYTGFVDALLPMIQDGQWYIVVRPDIYNEVYEGDIVYTETGLNIAPAEANNETASATTFSVTVPNLLLNTSTDLQLSSGDQYLYKLQVGQGETLRVHLDSSALKGSTELYIRYEAVPSAGQYDYAYTVPNSPDQELMVPTTQAGTYYILVKASNSPKGTAATILAETLPLSITKVTPDQGGTGTDDYRWVTMDIYGAQFAAGALIKLSRPGVYEVEPERWQVLDATHIRAIFDLRQVPHGLYDIIVTNPNGDRVVEPYRYLVERAIEPDVTIGLGGLSQIAPGETGIYSVSLQSLTNVDTPYVRLDIGAVEMGYNESLIEGLNLPFLIFGSNVGGQPSGIVVGDQANTQQYGVTPTDKSKISQIPWASLDGTLNTSGINLAPGYAFDVNAAGYTGFTFNIKTYPGLKEWINMDFEGLREQLYIVHPEWRSQGLLDGGVLDLSKIQRGLPARFLDTETRLTETEMLALDFRFNIAAAATPITRNEFIQDQIKHALKMRDAILQDTSASTNLKALAADGAQWAQGWLAALEDAGLLRPENQAPAIKESIQVLSLTANLASGILLSKAGESFQTKASVLSFFEQMQKWYGDTSKWAGDPNALKAQIDYYELRQDDLGNSATSPVPKNITQEDLILNNESNTHFINFNIFAGDKAQSEYLRHIGLLDGEFRPIGAQALALSQYLQQMAAVNTDVIHVQGPSVMPHTDGKSYVPSETALPFKLNFQNTTEQSLHEIRLVTAIDEQLDPYSLRLTDMKIGDINIHVPENRSSFSSDFDFTGSLGFILRVSAGVDTESHIVTWLIQAIDPNTGEVSTQNLHRLLKLSENNKGFVGYTIQSAETAKSNEEIITQARIYLNNTPPVDSQSSTYILDNQRPVTTVQVVSEQSTVENQVHYKVKWSAQDDVSGIKHVTLYVAENGRDFKIWQKQLTQANGELLFVGQTDTQYEFLAVATDVAGNQEIAKVSNAVIPDDGSRQQLLTQIGSNEALQQTAQIPQATQDRSYLNNTIFAETQKGLVGQTDKNQNTDLNSVLSPFTLNAFASGFNASQGEVGALAMVELPDHRILVSAGQYRNQLFIYGEHGGTQQKPLYTFEQPILDMALDSKGQLWVLTGQELWLLDYSTGQIIERIKGPADEPLTHALTIEPATDRIYVSSGNGIEIFDINAPKGQQWTHFSNALVSDLSFAPDGRLWAVRWTSTNVLSHLGKTDIISLPLTGKTKGRAEVEYTLNGLIDSLVFGQKGTAFEGLLFASANNSQQLSNGSKSLPKLDNAAVWMISLAKRQAVQLAQGGARGESILITHDQRILVAQTNRIDEIALLKAPIITASSIQDGAYIPLPLANATITFDQAMWLGNNGNDSTDIASVLNPTNYRFVGIGKNVNQVLSPESVQWDNATNSVILTLPNIAAGQWRLEVSSNVQSAKQTRLEGVYTAAFTTVTDYSASVSIEFDKTRADRLNGTVSYDVKITNIGQDNIQGPLLLLLDPGHYFNGGIVSATQGQGIQNELWLLDVSSYLQAHGGSLKVGEKLAGITVSVVKAEDLALSNDAARLLKFDLTHQIYALPYDNQPPVISYDETKLKAKVNESWNLDLTATDQDGKQFYWSIVEAPQGVRIDAVTTGQASDQGYQAHAQLHWTPTTQDRVDSEILVKVVDSRGGFALKRLKIQVDGANHVPVITTIRDIDLTEGQSLSQQLLAADEDGDRISMVVRNLPAGAEFDVTTGMLTWTPAYDQAGKYENIELVVSDGKHESRYQFNITVKQGYEKPVLLPVAAQQLREGERFSLQLAGSLPHGLMQYAGQDIKLNYSAEWLPNGAILNKDTGWLEWTPGYAQAGSYDIPIRLVATYTPTNGGIPVRTVATQTLSLVVNNVNAAPQFESSPTWTVLEGASVRLNIFAFDPDNPGFEPAFKSHPQSKAVQMSDVPASVSYEVTGLPEGATFDPETLEIEWNPNYQQSGIYKIKVVATDDGNGTGQPLSTERTFTINVLNANRTPEIGDVQSVIVDKGAVIEIPITATDKDGNPIELQIEGLPNFATYTQSQSGSNVKGVIRFAPQAGHRGDYTITVTARDNGDGDINQVQVERKSFVVTVRSYSEAPSLSVPTRNVAVVGQQIRVPITVVDLDQDTLNYIVQGLPAGAQLVQSAKYGYAEIVWTPTANQVGQYDLSVQVSDQGLPPKDLGYPVPESFVTVPNVVAQDIRIVVRATNLAPELLDVQVQQGGSVVQQADQIILQAQEGQPLTWTMTVKDADLDQLYWSFSALPKGVNITTQALGNGQSQLVLKWLPSMFAAQSSLGSSQLGNYNFTVTVTDGSAKLNRNIQIQVAHVNQQPVFTSLPLQLVYEGETLSFNLLAQDGDNDALRYQLVHDANTPADIYVDATTGYVEWTPANNIVDNQFGDQKAFDLTFMVTDGQTSVLKTVQVRVLDVNKTPKIQSSNRTLVVGQQFQLDVVKSAQNSLNNNRNIYVSDIDGQTQTQGLIVSFDQLPQGASYDAVTGRLSWTPNAGQIGKFVTYVRVSDGYDTVRQAITFNVVVDRNAYKPALHIETTPAIPVVAGQIVTATVRADSFSTIANTMVEVRGSALGTDQWQVASLDSSGRIKLTGQQLGLIEIRATAIDIDGFTQQQVQTIRVKDPQDNLAPVLAWQGQLKGAAITTASIVVQNITDLTASIKEQQLMGYKLEIARNTTGLLQWYTLQDVSLKASYSNQTLDIFTIDPALFVNGAYQLRLTAWDLVGRVEELYANIEINSVTKQLNQATHVDASLQIGSQKIDLVRSITTDSHGDFSNWTTGLFDTQLTHNQRLNNSVGTVAAWQTGAKVWLQIPQGLTAIQTQYLNFTLNLQTQDVTSENTGLHQFIPQFSNAQGWSLTAYSSADLHIDNLIQQGQSLYNESTGLAWVPSYFNLTAPDGTRYLLDQAGKVLSIHFNTGEQWIVSQNNIVLVGGKTSQSIEFKSDSQGRISQIIGQGSQGEPISLLYKYNSANQLELVRNLITGKVVQRYSYTATGEVRLEKAIAYLGASVDWLNQNHSAPQWQGDLNNQTQYFDFAIRESELASTIKAMGATGAVLVAVETQGNVQNINVADATIVSQQRYGEHTVTLVRITSAGFKQLAIDGTGTVAVRLSIVGDINHDGNVDGLDSALLQQAQEGQNQFDLNGDGLVNNTDLQILYANYGWKSNQAPVNVVAQGTQALKTHRDLSVTGQLDQIAVDREGDAVYWNILSSTHGVAQLSSNGKNLSFKPEAGFSGYATVTLQADDGYSKGQPIELKIYVSDAKLVLIHIERLAAVALGNSAGLHVTGDFADEDGVTLTADYLQFVSDNPDVLTVDAKGNITTKKSGIATVHVAARGIEGVNVISVVICAELAGDFHLGYARQLTDKSSLL